jgi:hypothetical protein
MHPPCVPPTVSRLGVPFSPPGPCGWFPRFGDTLGRSDSPPSVSACFGFFASRCHRYARGLLPSIVGVPPEATRYRVPGSSSGMAMETSGSLRFLGNPDGHCACSSTLAGSGRLTGPRVSCLTRPPLTSTAKAPCVVGFRGSVTRPLTWLSTLRRGGYPLPRKTRSWLLVRLYQAGLVLAQFPQKRSEFVPLSPFQGFPDARSLR